MSVKEMLNKWCFVHHKRSLSESLNMFCIDRRTLHFYLSKLKRWSHFKTKFYFLSKHAKVKRYSSCALVCCFIYIDIYIDICWNSPVIVAKYLYFHIILTFMWKPPLIILRLFYEWTVYQGPGQSCLSQGGGCWSSCGNNCSCENRWEYNQVKESQLLLHCILCYTFSQVHSHFLFTQLFT